MICDSKSSWKSDIKQHVDAEHGGICHLCEYEAKRKGDLKKHVEAEHEGICFTRVTIRPRENIT